jgi:hypothetical protein
MALSGASPLKFTGMYALTVLKHSNSPRSESDAYFHLTKSQKITKRIFAHKNTGKISPRSDQRG